MIKKLKIQNFVLIKNIEIEFSPNFNIIIGETGSGKSLIIDALMIVFGDRASNEIIRSGELKTTIEVEIINYNPFINKILEFNNIDIHHNYLILRREINSKGLNRNFVNDIPVNLSILKEIGNYLIDFHGQHEHQSLLNSENHISILDKYGNLDNDINNFNELLDKLKSKYYEIIELTNKEKENKELLEYQRIFLQDVNIINPISDEDILIENELSILENTEIINQIGNDLYDMLYNNDSSIFSQLSKVEFLLNKLKNFNINIEEQLNEINYSKISAKEIALYITELIEKYNLDYEKIDYLRNRQIQIKGLIKKYGNLNDIIRKKNKIEEQINLVENFAEIIHNLKSEYYNLQIECGKLAEKITLARKEIAKKLSKKIVESLNLMGISYVDFKVNFDKIVEDKNNLSVCINDKFYKIINNGVDLVEFIISTNKGMDAKPLKEVASGGEISRIMLSLKELISEKDIIDTMVFDEIDTGISGRIAQMVGRVMQKISLSKQIIAITHLPQIASYADKIFNVEKKELTDTNMTIIKELSLNEKVIEIAKMIGGEIISDSALKSATELINQSKQ